MLSGFWGKKIGMTQLYHGGKIVPVTVIDTGIWYVTQVKTVEKDGYNAVQIGLVYEKHAQKEFDAHWLTKKAHYFSIVREVQCDNSADLLVGNSVDIAAVVEVGALVDVAGWSKGRGFAGVVKRHGFSGGRASHGPRFGRIPGSLSFMRSQGRVIKGKKLPGHFGTDRHTIRKLKVMRVEPSSRAIFVKGAVPGATGSLLYIQKI